MASIDSRNGSFRVSIRRKGIQISKSFKNIEDANLYAAYKEDLIDNIQAFQPPLEEMVTLSDAIDIKLKDAQDDNIDQKSIGRIIALKEQFSEFENVPISQITYEQLLKKSKKFSESEVRRGGSEKNGGNYRLPSKQTVLNRFVVLSTVYSLLNSTGIPVENIALKLVKYLRSKL